jgi:hypothetical protein
VKKNTLFRVQLFLVIRPHKISGFFRKNLAAHLFLNKLYRSLIDRLQ